MKDISDLPRNHIEAALTWLADYRREHGQFPAGPLMAALYRLQDDPSQLFERICALDPSRPLSLVERWQLDDEGFKRSIVVTPPTEESLRQAAERRKALGLDVEKEGTDE